MKRAKIILLAAAVGAVIGVVVVLVGGHSSKVAAFTRDPAMAEHHRFLFAAIPWILFSLYWEVAAKNAAPAKSAESKASRGFHVTLTNIAILLQIAPIRGLGRFLPASSLYLTAGVSVELFGLFIAIWARRSLGRNWSGEISIKVEHELIRSGPYRFLRHPIYTGVLTMYLGTVVTTGESLAIVGLAIAGYAYWRKIRLEEMNLRVAFGEAYNVYCQETWALVPGLF